MQLPFPEESQFADYINSASAQFADEKAVICSLIEELSMTKPFVNNKDIILGLLRKLETETDPVQLDIYRKALELVVQRTPDDMVL
ncbi:biofilm/acid-resistance regulator YmgB/AriR [[Erwinia] mediterraneensis]|uniref:biofilm/acid-resistance regulator YmgB/AriR n=1 Tax=[Erwinia] mediterraneensis TaxID=2161819 RepID=UPI00102FBC2E|nr:biofilm/acid-resistance regulator YmgB/AriR [[Erwinia] mediterraneensis]